MINKTEGKMDKKECLRCGHEWLPRIEARPKSCPACKNRKWDEVRNEKPGN